MAAYGAQLKQGKSPQEALGYLEQLLRNTPVQDKSAREALQTFAAGKGDVLLAYENEAITAQQKDVPLDYVVPDQTILIQNPVAVTKDAKPQAKQFVDWLRTDEAQKIYAGKGYRSVNASLVDASKFPTPKQLFKIAFVGGWGKVNDEFFDTETGAVLKIEEKLGVSTAK
jgi:sulfate transport system substrate-binding protein